jgi:hypothetical protein
MIEQVDWNFYSKVAVTGSHRQKMDYSTAHCCTLFSWDAKITSN